jgi:hypothetical protein
MRRHGTSLDVVRLAALVAALATGCGSLEPPSCPAGEAIVIADHSSDREDDWRASGVMSDYALYHDHPDPTVSFPGRLGFRLTDVAVRLEWSQRLVPGRSVAVRGQVTRGDDYPWRDCDRGDLPPAGNLTLTEDGELQFDLPKMAPTGTLGGCFNPSLHVVGCVAPVDRDGDGVPDGIDACPDEPGEDRDDGCPGPGAT